MSDALRIGLGAPNWGTANGFSVTNTTINATTTRAAFVFQISHADTITHVGFRQGQTLGTPGTNNFRATLMSVDSSGLPNADVGSTAATFTPVAANDGTWVWVPLTNSYAATRGQFLAVMIDTVSGDNANNISVGRLLTQHFHGQGLPYSLTYAGSWTKSTAQNVTAVWGAKSASRVYGLPVIGTTQSTTSTVGQRVAMKFTLPAAWGTTFKIMGVRFFSSTFAGGSTFGLGIWNAAGTLLQGSTSYDSDHFNQSGGNNSGMELYFNDTDLTPLSFGGTYYIGFQSGGANVRLNTLDFSNANDRLALPLGTNACFSQWLDSQWDDTTTRLPWLELILDDITGGGIPRSRVFTGR